MDRHDGDEAKRLRQGAGEHLGFYEVGYGKPPKATRFQKGRSGNPQGRPSRKASEHEAALSDIERQFLAQIRQKVTIRDGQGERTASLLDAVLRSELQTALKGNPIAQRNVIERAARAQAIEQQEIAETNETLGRWQAQARAEIAKARKEGKPAPEFEFHPDDLELQPGQRPRFLGPVTAATREMVKVYAAVRDALLMQAALEAKLYRDEDHRPVDERRWGAGVLLELINRQLPPSLRLTDTQLAVRLMRYEDTPKPQILKQVRAAWRAAGSRAPRGFVFPTVGVIKQKVELGFATADELLRQMRERDSAP